MSGGGKTAVLQGRIKEFVERLADQTEQAASSKALVDYLRFAGSFHEYSLHNTMLIFSQRPERASRDPFHNTMHKSFCDERATRCTTLYGYPSATTLAIHAMCKG